MDGEIELFLMAQFYGSTCTQQEEKFIAITQRTGCDWTWEDCEAASQLLLEKYQSYYYVIKDALRKSGTFEGEYWV